MNSMGCADILIGLQYGDEGKAKVIDAIADDYEIIARFNGGANAGHTISVNGATIALHQIPSGVFHPTKKLYIGSGCVVSPASIASELGALAKLGIFLDGRLHISSLASVVQPHHILADQLFFEAIGTTKQGIGPAYADRALRVHGERLLNIRTGHLLADFTDAIKCVRGNLAGFVREHELTLSHEEADSLLNNFIVASRSMLPHIEEDPLFLSSLVSKGASVLFEGAQSFMLDVAWGAVPFVTSSHTIAAAAYTGGDLHPKYHRRTIGVAKAVMSRVGNGPFVSEFGGNRSQSYCASAPLDCQASEQVHAESLLGSGDAFNIGIALRALSGEYGATTGRPRRTGALDLVQLRYAVECNGVDQLFLNKCDTLSLFSRTEGGRIPVVTSYCLDEKVVSFPPTTQIQERVTPSFEYWSAFSTNLQSFTAWNELPQVLKDLISDISNRICPVMGIGVGPGREQLIMRP